jgi:digeranylgeranylglycerophospholipid reductase
MNLYDVAVIGGGPVGSRVASRLAGMGHRVVVLEQKERAGEGVCCTGIVSQECTRTFAIEDDLILREVVSATLFSPSGKALRLERPDTRACILDRPAFDNALARRAQDKGAEYVFSSRANNLEVGSDRVKIETLRQGKRTRFEARAVVIASGFNSRLVEELRLGSISHFFAGAQAEVETAPLDEMEVYFGEEIAPGFFAWLVPSSPSRARVGLLARHHPAHYLRKLISSLAIQGKIASAEAELSFGRVPVKPLARTYFERLLVVGTAAGQVKPTTGGGIYYGLLCADIAAETLKQALASNDLSAKGLASYERAWQKKLGGELKKGYRVRKFYERLNDPQIDRLFDTIDAEGMAQVLLGDSKVSFDWHSGGLLRILGNAALSRVSQVMKRPLHSRHRRQA